PPGLIPYITAEELAERGKFELVSIMFHLERLTPEEAESEIKKLLGPQGKIEVFTRAKQISVTETAGRLQTIKRVIDATERPDAATLENLRAISIRYAKPDDVLAIVKQLMNIPTERNTTTDGSLRIVSDPAARNLLVSGKADQIAKVEEILKTVDVASPGNPGAHGLEGFPQLEVYAIAGADPAMVLQVLQTLLAGAPDVRLSTDPATGHLVALARPSQHATIRATIEQMQRDSQKIEVVRLRTVDPYTAKTAIDKLFGGDGETPNPTAPKIEAEPTTRQLIIRGSTSQLAQIRSMLDKMGESSQDSLAGSDSSNLRMIPLTGSSARNALGQIEHLWPTMHKNKIRVVTPSQLNSAPASRGESQPRGTSSIPQRTPSASRGPLTPSTRQATTARSANAEIAPSQQPQSGVEAPAKAPAENGEKNESPLPPSKPTEQKPPVDANPIADRQANAVHGSRRTTRAILAVQRFDELPTDAPLAPAQNPLPSGEPITEDALAENQNDLEPSPIIVAPGPGGIMIASEDTAALDKFEELLRSLGSRSAGDQDFTVFYLKYGKADVIGSLLEQIFSGGGSSSSAGGGSLVGDLAGAALGEMGGGMLGGLMGGGGRVRGGAATPTIRASGTIAIVPDTRLNALVVQANATDLDTIEQLLTVLDQKDSPEDILVLAKPQLIPVYYTGADEIATVVRQVYADRITGAAGASAQSQRPSPEDFVRALRGGGSSRDGGKGNQADVVQKMSIGVDMRTNSLVVTAPESLFKEVQTLVEQLDQETTTTSDTMKVVTLKRTNPAAVQSALRQIVGDQARIGTSNSAANPGATSSGRGAVNVEGRPSDIYSRLQGSGMFGDRSNGGSSDRGYSGRSPYGSRDSGSDGSGSYGSSRDGGSSRDSSSRGYSGRSSSGRSSSGRGR
ncbi:MAG: secretin N-terminal domain-containing protein, partial [Planctomycetota bacterium]|nr:secretin N-terminal domain-containing protein [Planctomycetota bacterium]